VEGWRFCLGAGGEGWGGERGDAGVYGDMDVGRGAGCGGGVDVA